MLRLPFLLALALTSFYATPTLAASNAPTELTLRVMAYNVRSASNQPPNA